MELICNCNVDKEKDFKDGPNVNFDLGKIPLCTMDLHMVGIIFSLVTLAIYASIFSIHSSFLIASYFMSASFSIFFCIYCCRLSFLYPSAFLYFCHSVFSYIEAASLHLRLFFPLAMLCIKELCFRSDSRNSAS